MNVLFRWWFVASVVMAAVGAVPANDALSKSETVMAEGTPSSPPLTLTLRGAMDAAVGNNPTVQLYKERIEAARAQVRTQLGAMLPNVSSTFQQSRQTNFLGTLGLAPVRTQPFSIVDARVNASQNLLSLSLIQKWRASRESLRVAEFEADVNMFDTMANVALFYIDALKAKAMLKAHEANRQVMRELLNVVTLRHRNGVATGIDTARLESQLANEGQLLSTAQYDRTRARLNLITQLGLPIETVISLSDSLQAIVGETTAPERAVEEAIGKRPEVQAQAKRVRAAELTYSSITGERIPSLVAQGNYGLIGNQYTNTTDTYNMALILQVPIFDGGQREGRIGEARSQIQQEIWQMRAVLNQVTLEVHDAKASLDAARDQVTIASGGLQSALRELELARERFATVSGNNQFEVTNALNSVTRARENLVTALYQLNAARVNVARATGNLAVLN